MYDTYIGHFQSPHCWVKKRNNMETGSVSVISMKPSKWMEWVSEGGREPAESSAGTGGTNSSSHTAHLVKDETPFQRTQNS
jgi:hypothetical protein